MFRGNEYRHDHFVTPRSIEGYYPTDKHAGDRFVGRCALGLFVVLAIVCLWGAL